ncbi:uncharacterized protein LOC126776525 isoform X1 [Nymphalis io]|uniref:uncharacterized protein LOC126776525 isoform X1 n=1 Tax=Inachis io TaxID=171585 RepID=UPI00216859D6|nr:uncharacterized protein LOC126776525 isoform X1 [Nymphalis io]
MVQFISSDIIILLFLLDVAITFVPNVPDVKNLYLKGVETRRKKNKKDRSTSSSEQARGRDSKSSDTDKESLDLSSQEFTSSSDESKGRPDRPQSSEERRGWRKWHRKCPPCPEDMAKKWRDPTIEWICGGYQRARRSFKSLCMMQYRNCQDGTMFVKIHDQRCANDTGRDQRRGIHFFYDYKVQLSEDSSESTASSSSFTEDSSDW